MSGIARAGVGRVDLAVTRPGCGRAGLRTGSLDRSWTEATASRAWPGPSYRVTTASAGTQTAQRSSVTARSQIGRSRRGTDGRAVSSIVGDLRLPPPAWRSPAISKSGGSHIPCGFESRLRHCSSDGLTAPLQQPDRDNRRADRDRPMYNRFRCISRPEFSPPPGAPGLGGQHRPCSTTPLTLGDAWDAHPLTRPRRAQSAAARLRVACNVLMLT